MNTGTLILVGGLGIAAYLLIAGMPGALPPAPPPTTPLQRVLSDAAKGIPQIPNAAKGAFSVATPVVGGLIGFGSSGGRTGGDWRTTGAWNPS